MQKIKFIILALIFSICSSMARPMDSSFFKTWEEKELNLECDSGEGKYSACTRLVEIFYGGNIHRAIGYFDKVCYGKESDKKDFSCKVKEQLEICLSDSECNPLRKAVSILVPR